MPALCLQAALELFPTVGITPVTAETYPHWVSTDPTRVRVRWVAAAVGSTQGHQRLVRGSAKGMLIPHVPLPPAHRCCWLHLAAGDAFYRQGGAAAVVPRPQVRNVS